MDVTRLRAIMQRYREAGVLLVGAYLVGRHLWTKRRIALLTTPALLLIVACFLAGVLKGPDLASKRPVTPSLPVVSSTEPSSPIYRPQHPLLPQARLVAALDKYYFTHLWASTDHLLLVTSAQPTRIYDSIDVFPGEWKGQADLLDLRTGRRHRLEGLTRIFQRIHAMPCWFETSPGGAWLKWSNSDTFNGWPNPVVAHWDGSKFQQWSQDKGTDIYWLDDHRWVEDKTHSDDETKGSKELIVHNADAQKTVNVKLHSKVGQKLVRVHNASCEHAFDSSWKSETTPAPTVTISEKQSAEGEDAPTPPLHTYAIRMPVGAEVREVHVSPKTRRVLYALHFRQVSEGIRPQPKYGCFDLWSSRLDGSDLKELGYVETGALDYSEDEDPMTAQNMINIEWLPDGKNFSFIYRKKLYRAAGY